MHNSTGVLKFHIYWTQDVYTLSTEHLSLACACAHQTVVCSAHHFQSFMSKDCVWLRRWPFLFRQELCCSFICFPIVHSPLRSAVQSLPSSSESSPTLTSPWRSTLPSQRLIFLGTWFSYSQTLIVFGRLLFLNSSFKRSHFLRTCPRPLSYCP